MPVAPPTIAIEMMPAIMQYSITVPPELQGLPLPSQCEGCYSQKAGRPSKSPKPKLEKKDVRAGAAPPLDTGGH